ncbi:MAG: hypothetical protein KY429_09865 [Actinobacteria bacterium]|nr:hypothetical protein [Actinomycetota bacterium]
MQLLAILATGLALLGYSGIRVIQDSAAVQKQTADTTQEPSRDESGSDGVQSASGGPLESSAGQPAAKKSLGRPGSSKVRGGSGAGRSSAGSGTLTADPLDFIAFNRDCDTAQCDTSKPEIHRIRADGSDDRHLLKGVAPSWSRDGKRIAFGTSYRPANLQVMNADGSSWRDLKVEGAFPAWSPDGLRLAFNWKCESPHWTAYPGSCWQYTETPRAYGCGPAECGIGVVDADGRTPRRLGNGIWPDWGPDGRIVFTDGTPTEPCQYGTAYWYDVNPHTSFESPYRLPNCALPLWVMNADGSGRTALPIAKATAPKWSPDGKRIAYHVETEGIFISNADGTGIVKVAPAGFMDPSWSPDGKTLALTRRTTDAFIWSIFVRAVDGSGEKQLTSGPRDTLPSFSLHR